MILGVTGGVGSGKSAVTGILSEKYGYRLLLTDDIAKETERPGEAGYEALTSEFGDAILESGAGSPISKAAFAALIYSDSEALRKVNSLIHPIVWDIVENIVREERGAAGKARIAVETALPCERFRNMCDELWFVYADKETRISRLTESRGYSREKCISIIESQYQDEEFLAYADYVVDNSGSIEDTALRIQELL